MIKLNSNNPKLKNNKFILGKGFTNNSIKFKKIDNNNQNKKLIRKSYKVTKSIEKNKLPHEQKMFIQSLITGKGFKRL